MNKKHRFVKTTILLSILCISVMLPSTYNVSANDNYIEFRWTTIRVAHTHDPDDDGKFYLKIKYKVDGDDETEKTSKYEYEIGLHFPHWEKVLNNGAKIDYPGYVYVQLWEDDFIGDDLVIDWFSTRIPAGTTFTTQYEAGGGCYVTIYLTNFGN